MLTEVFMSTMIFLRHHSFDASPFILFMSILWVIAGATLLMSPQIGSPWLFSFYLQDIMRAIMLLRDIFFAPKYSTFAFFWAFLLDAFPLLLVTLIRFYTPRPPNKFVYILCFVGQVFVFIWLELCGPNIYYSLITSLNFTLWSILKDFLCSGMGALFSMRSITLCLYCCFIIFHYQLNLSFIYAQNTASIKASRFFFAPTFIPLHRFRLFYLLSLFVQNIVENIVFSIYLAYCILLFVNAYLISSRGSLSYVHNWPWITLFVSSFIMCFSLYNLSSTIACIYFNIMNKYSLLSIGLFMGALVVSLLLASMLVAFGKRSRISIINDQKLVRTRYSYSLRRKRLSIWIISTLSRKHLKFKVLTPLATASSTPDEHTDGENNVAADGVADKAATDGLHEPSQSASDTILLLDPVSVQNYTLHTSLSLNMVLSLAFYFDLHNVLTIILPNTYGLTPEDIYSLTYASGGNEAVRKVFKDLYADRMAPFADNAVSTSKLSRVASRKQLPRSKDLFHFATVFNELPPTAAARPKRQRSFSVMFQRHTLLSTGFSIPNTQFKKLRNAQLSSTTDLHEAPSKGCLSRVDSAFTDLLDIADDEQLISEAMSILQYKSSDDSLISRSNVLLEDQLVYRYMPKAYNVTKLPSLALGINSLDLSAKSQGAPKKAVPTPNQRILQTFLASLDPKKIFPYIIQAESILETLRLLYENIYASLFLSYCAASQTLESMTLLDIEECLPVPLLLKYMRAWNTPVDAYNSIIYYIDQLKHFDDLKREYIPMRNNRFRAPNAPDSANEIVVETIFLNVRKIPDFRCKDMCNNCNHCTASVKCNHCHTKIVLHLKAMFYLIFDQRDGEHLAPFKNFTCSVCGWRYLLKLAEPRFLQHKKREQLAKGDQSSISPKLLHDYITFLGKLTPIGRPVKSSYMWRKKIALAENVRTLPFTESKRRRILQNARLHSRKFIQEMFKAHVNSIDGDSSKVLGMRCPWVDGVDESGGVGANGADKQGSPGSESKKFSMDRNVGLLHKSYSAISPQDLNGSMYFMSPEVFTDVALTDGAKKFFYNCKRQNYLFSILLPTITSTSSTTGNIHRLSFAYDRPASLTGPLRTLRMKALIHLARILFPAELYVNNIYPIQLVPSYRFHSFGRSYIENASSRLRVMYSPEFILKRMEDFEVRVIGIRTNLRKMVQGIIHQDSLYLYCLAQNALTVKTQDKVDSSILQFITVEYTFLQVAFTGVGDPYLSFFYQLYYTNNMSFFRHLLSLSKINDNGVSLAEVASKLDQYRPSLSAVAGSTIINALAVSLNCHALSDQAADAYAVIQRVFTAMYSTHFSMYTWVEMIKIRLSTCDAYLDLIYTMNADIFASIETTQTHSQTQSQVQTRRPSIFETPTVQGNGSQEFETDSNDERDEADCTPDLPSRHIGINKALLNTPIKHGHSFGIHTARDFYKLQALVKKLFLSCQALLDKTSNEFYHTDESHELQASRLMQECSDFFVQYYVVATLNLLHLTFDLPMLVDYAPPASQQDPVCNYNNGVSYVIQQTKKDTDQFGWSFVSITDMECQTIGVMDAELPSPRHPGINDNVSDTAQRQNFDQEIDDTPKNYFDRFFLPRLPHMAADSYPKSMVISKKQIVANLFAVYDHVILENDLLETVLLNNVSINGLPSISFNHTSFSLLHLLGRCPLQLVAQRKYPVSLDLGKFGGPPPQEVEIDLLESLLNSYDWDLRKEAFLDKMLSYFNSKTLYEKVGENKYVRVKAKRLQQIVYLLHCYSPSEDNTRGATVLPVDSILHNSRMSDADDSAFPPNLAERPEMRDFSKYVFQDRSVTLAAGSYTVADGTLSMMSSTSINSTDTLSSLTLGAEQLGTGARQRVLNPSKRMPWKAAWRVPRLLRKVFSKEPKTASHFAPRMGNIKLYYKTKHTYCAIAWPSAPPHTPNLLVLDSVNRQQLLLSLIISFNLMHLYTSSNAMTAYEYRGRQLLTLQQNHFIVDATGEYYPAFHRHELEQSYSLNFNTQSPEDAVKRFIYCFSEAFINPAPTKSATGSKRYINTDFDLTIPVEGMQYVHTSDVHDHSQVVVSRSKWLENLTQPDTNTPINVYECIERQISVQGTTLLHKSTIGLKNTMLYYSIIFDSLIQLRNIIRVDSTLRATIHAYKMLPRLAFFSAYLDRLLACFFEGAIDMHKSFASAPQQTGEHLRRASNIVAHDGEGDQSLMPLLIPHCTDLKACLKTLQAVETSFQNLWTMRLILLRHSYAEEDFLLLMQNDCLRGLGSSYGLSHGVVGDYFYALFTNIIKTQYKGELFYTRPPMERIFRSYYAKASATTSTDQKLSIMTTSTGHQSTGRNAPAINQWNIIRYFALMEHNARKIETANREFFIALGELFAFGKDKLGYIQKMASTAPKVAGIYILGPDSNTLHSHDMRSGASLSLTISSSYTSDLHAVSLTPADKVTTDSGLMDHALHRPPEQSTTNLVGMAPPENTSHHSMVVTSSSFLDKRHVGGGHNPQKFVHTTVTQKKEKLVEYVKQEEKVEEPKEVFLNRTMRLRARIYDKYYSIRKYSSFILLILFYANLMFYLLLIYSYFLTSHLVAKNLVQHQSRVAGMMAAFSDLRTEIAMNAALQKTTVQPFEIQSTYVERFNEVANNGLLAHQIASAMYNTMSITDVFNTELQTPNMWPPPILYLSGEKLISPGDTKYAGEAHQRITCNLNSATLTNVSLEAILKPENKWISNISYFKHSFMPFYNLKQLLLGLNSLRGEFGLVGINKQKMWSYLKNYYKLYPVLYSRPFRMLLHRHPIIAPIVSAQQPEVNGVPAEPNVNPAGVDYFTATELLINRAICVAASLISFTRERAVSTNGRADTSNDITNIQLEADFLLTVYQNIYNHYQEVLLNSWGIHSEYALNKLVCLAIGIIGFGLFIPLYNLHFKTTQRRLLLAKLDRACTLANFMSLPPDVLATILDNYKKSSMVPFKQFWWSNTHSSQLRVKPPREYYSDIYSCTQSRSVYNQTYFKSAELVVSSSKSVAKHANIDSHTDPDSRSELYSHTDEVALILRLISNYERVSRSKIYIALYALISAIFLCFISIIIIFPFYFAEPYSLSELTINNYFGTWGNISYFSFKTSVNGWDPNRLSITQIAQEQIYNINSITQQWSAPGSTPPNFAVDGRRIAEYMNAAYKVRYLENKFNTPFFINKYRNVPALTAVPYIYEYLRDYTTFAAALIQWLNDVNFMNSVGQDPDRCTQCTQIYYLLQYVLQAYPVSLVYHGEVAYSLTKKRTPDFLQSDHYTDFFTVHKRMLDLFSEIHTMLWSGAGAKADNAILHTLHERYKYFTNFRDTRLDSYTTQAAMTLITSVPPNMPLPSMIKRYETVVANLIYRLYGGYIIVNGFSFLLFLTALISYLVVGYVFICKSIFLPLMTYIKVCNVTRCSCSVKYLMSCFLPIDLAIFAPLLLVVITVLSVAVLNSSIEIVITIFRNYFYYKETTRAILQINISLYHSLYSPTYANFSRVHTAMYSMLPALILFSCFSHNIFLRTKETIAMIGHVSYTKEQERTMFSHRQNPYIVCVNERLTICRPAEETIEQPEDTMSLDGGPYCNREVYHSMPHGESMNDQNNTHTHTDNEGETEGETPLSANNDTKESEGSSGPFSIIKTVVNTSYKLPIFLPPISVPRQKLEIIEIFVRYFLVALFLASMYILISILRRSEYTPKNIPTVFFDQLIYNYNLIRAQISQMYAYPASGYKETHLYINPFIQFRHMLAFLLANKYTHSMLFTPIQTMRAFKDKAIDAEFYAYGQNIKSFLRSDIDGFGSNVAIDMLPISYSESQESFISTTWLNSNQYYNTWSTFSPRTRSRTFSKTKLPNYYKDRTADNSILLPLYQQLLIHEYAYYQSNFANSEDELEDVLVRSPLGTYGNSFASLGPESKRVLFYDIARHQIWKDALYCDHYLRIASTLLHAVATSKYFLSLIILVLIVDVIAVTHIIGFSLLLLLYNRKLTLYEIFTTLFLKRMRGLIN